MRVCLCYMALAAMLLAGCRAVEKAEWPAVGGDPGNTRYSKLKQINTGNVKNLGDAWAVKLNAAGTSSAIVVSDGRMFVTAGAEVFALDAEKGRTVWSYQAAASPAAKGVAVGGGRVYVGLANTDLIALDENTG